MMNVAKQATQQAKVPCTDALRLFASQIIHGMTRAKVLARILNSIQGRNRSVNAGKIIWFVKNSDVFTILCAYSGYQASGAGGGGPGLAERTWALTNGHSSATWHG